MLELEQELHEFELNKAKASEEPRNGECFYRALDDVLVERKAGCAAKVGLGAGALMAGYAVAKAATVYSFPAVIPMVVFAAPAAAVMVGGIATMVTVAAISAIHGANKEVSAHEPLKKAITARDDKSIVEFCLDHGVEIDYAHVMERLTFPTEPAEYKNI